MQQRPSLRVILIQISLWGYFKSTILKEKKESKRDNAIFPQRNTSTHCFVPFFAT